MLADLAKKESKKIESGTVVENMLDGYYRVNISGTIHTVNNQTSNTMPVGTIVSVTNTTWGRFIVSGNKRHASDIQKIIVRG